MLDSSKNTIRPIIKFSNTPSNAQQGTTKKNPPKIVKLPSVNNHMHILTDNSDFYVHKQIGAGAFSKVYTATRKIDGLQCVIKVYENSQFSTETRKQNLKNELSALKLPPHPNIIKFIDHFKTNGQTVIVMENFTHDSLTEFAKSHRPISA